MISFFFQNLEIPNKLPVVEEKIAEINEAARCSREQNTQHSDAVAKVFTLLFLLSSF